MVRVTYVQPDGSSREVRLSAGTSLMQGALDNGISGIVAECGGACVCATCHIYVDEAYLGLLDKPTPTEDEMLDAVAAERRDNSRLSCQIKASERLDGIVLGVPDEQI